MYTSGQFAGKWRVSKKLLRHYHDIGLLTPSVIDPRNGYQYYTDADGLRMTKILYLRSMRIPLGRIAQMLDMPQAEWKSPLCQQLEVIRAELRVLTAIDRELVMIVGRLQNGKESLITMEREIKYTLQTFSLDEPIYVVGRAADVKMGTPEHMPAVESVIEHFFADDVPATIPDRKLPAVRYGISAEFRMNEDPGLFTYMMGDQVAHAPRDQDLPKGTRSFTIQPGEYLCVSFDAPQKDQLVEGGLELAFGKATEWINSSAEYAWALSGVSVEVYEDDRFEVPSWPEMDLWVALQRK